MAVRRSGGGTGRSLPGARRADHGRQREPVRETDGNAVLPTPVIGVVGLLEDASKLLTRVFPAAGLEIVVLGENHGELGGGEY